ncbi:MAG: hypothetical protein AAF512_01380 [Pseudomonadota bacterium]
MALNDELQKQQGFLDGFKKQTPAAPDDFITGISVPVKLPRDGGNMRMYIHLSPEALANPETLNAALDQLGEIFDLDVWTPSSGSNSNGFKRNGYGNNNYGGYGRRNSWRN